MKLGAKEMRAAWKTGIPSITVQRQAHKMRQQNLGYQGFSQVSVHGYFIFLNGWLRQVTNFGLKHSVLQFDGRILRNQIIRASTEHKLHVHEECSALQFQRKNRNRKIDRRIIQNTFIETWEFTPHSQQSQDEWMKLLISWYLFLHHCTMRWWHAMENLPTALAER